MKYCNMPIKTILTLLFLSFFCSGIFAWQNGSDIVVTASGNTLQDHPPGLSNDIRDNTYTSFSGSYGWLKIDLGENRLIQALDIMGYIPDSVTAGIGYSQEGMQKMFPSGYAADKSGRFVLDVSSAAIVTDTLFLILSGADISQVQIQELSVQSQDPEDVFYKKKLIVTDASDNTSYQTSEFSIIDGYPGTFWSIQESRHWQDFPEFVRNQLENRYSYNRHGSRRKEASLDLALETPGSAETLRLYLCEEREGDLSVSIKSLGQWHEIDSFSLKRKNKGWLTYSIPSEYSVVEGIRLEVQSSRSSFGGIGEVELWGKEGYQGKSYSDLIAPNFSGEPGLTGFFTLQELKETDTYTLTLSVSGSGQEPEVSINGFEAVSDRSVQQDNIILFEYDLYPNQLWEGDNFVLVETGNSQNCLSMHLSEKVPADSGYLDYTSPVLHDGRTINGKFGTSEGVITLDGRFDLLRVKVFYSGTAPSRVYQQIQREPPNHPHRYSPYIENRNESGSEESGIGDLLSRIWNSTSHGRRRGHTPPMPSDEPKDYLDIVEQGDGYVVYTGQGMADLIGFTGGSDITEIQFLGSKTEESSPYIRILNPRAFGDYQKDDLNTKSLYGITDKPAGDIRINGQKAMVRGNIFWIPISAIGGFKSGIHSVTAEVEDREGRISSYEIEFYVQSEEYGISLDQSEEVYYTRDDTFRLSGTASSRRTRVFINDVPVTLNNNGFSYDVPLVDGLNLIKVNFVDSRRNRTVGYYMKRIFKFHGDFSIDIKVPSDGQYINADEVSVSGFVQGAGLSSVRINGMEGRVQGSAFSSISDIAIPESSNSLVVEAYDKSGYRVTESITVYRDTQAPELWGIEPEGGSWLNEKTVTFTGQVKDNNSCSVFVNGLMAIQSGESFLVTVPLKEGANTINVMAADLAGNVKRADPFTIHIDTTAPESFVPAAYPGSWTNERPEITYHTTDAGIGVSHYEISINGKGSIAQSSPYTVPFLDDGVNTIYVKAIDFLGNARTESIQVFIDTTPPDGPDNLRTVPGNDNITLKWTEPDEQVTGYEIQNPEGELYTIAKEEGLPWFDDELEFSWTESDLTAGQKRTYMFRSIDRAGNYSDPIEISGTSALAEVKTIENAATVIEYENVLVSVANGSVPEDIASLKMVITEDEEKENLAINPVVSPIYHFFGETSTGEEIEHIDFTEPFIGEIAYSEDSIPEGLSEENLQAYYFDTYWGAWFVIEDSLVDVENNKVVFSTDHFTDFTIQPTEVEDLSREELTNIEYSNFTGTVSHDPLNISAQSGSVSTSMSDFILPGRNGLDLSIRRLYNTSVAKENGRYGTARYVRDGYLKRTGAIIPALSFGQGWLLDLPHFKYTTGSVFIALPGGAYYDLNSLEVIDDEANENYLDDEVEIKYENHEGEDFTLKIIRDKKSDSEGKAYYTISSSVLYLKDGTSYYFNEMGLPKGIVDSTGAFKITILYKANLINKIIDTMGRTLEFTYSYGGTADDGNSEYPHIIDIKLAGSDRSFTYTYDSLTANGVRIPILRSAEESAERKWSYGYDEKILYSESGSYVSEDLDDHLKETFPDEYSDIAKTVYNGNTFVYGKKTVDHLYLLNSFSGPGNGTESVTYDVIALEKDYTSGLIFKRSHTHKYDHFPVVSEIKRSSTNSIENTKLLTESYSYTFETFKDDGYHYHNKKTIVENDILQTIYYYDKVKRESSRSIIGYDGDYGFKITRDEDDSTYYVPINTRIEYKDTNGNLLEYKTYLYDDQQRVIQEMLQKNYNHYSKTEYSYDDWGNRLTIGYEEKNGTALLTKTITNSFRPSFSDLSWVLKMKNKYVHNLVFETKIKEAYNSPGYSYTQPEQKTKYHYNEHGQKTYTGELLSGNEWADTYYSYYDISDSLIAANWNFNNTDGVAFSSVNRNELADLKTITSPSGHITSFSYSYPVISGSAEVGSQIISDYSVLGDYTVTQKEQDLGRADPDDTYTVITKKWYDYFTGNLVKYKNGENQVTVYEYDVYGRKTSEIRPQDSDEETVSISIAYNDSQLTTTHEDAEGAVTIYSFDYKGQLTSIEKNNRSGDNSKTDISYDSYGNITEITVPNGETDQIIKYTYDALDRLLSETFQSDEATHRRSYLYKDSENSRTTTRENGSIHYEQYDMSGNVIYSYDMDEDRNFIRSNTYGYNGEGKLLFETNPNGFSTYYKFDSRGNLANKTYTAVSGYDGAAEFSNTSLIKKYAYDDDGNLSVEKVFQGASQIGKTSYEYDGLGQVLKEIYSYSQDGVQKKSELSYEYDNNGNVRSVTDGNGIITYKTYTSRNQVDTEIDGDGYITEYDYDLEDRLIHMTDPRGTSGLHDGDFSIEYVYDDLDRLVKGILPRRNGDDSNPEVLLEYDPRGNLVKRTEPDMSYTKYEYNFRNWVTSETRTGTDGSYTTSYTYDENGNRLTVTEPGGAQWKYAYDGIDRVILETQPDGAEIRTLYDSMGNVIAKTNGNGFWSYFTYDAYNRLVSSKDPRGAETSYDYDIKGNRTRMTDPNNNTWEYLYDELDRMIRETNSRGDQAFYTYDAGSRLATLTDPNGTVVSYSYNNRNLPVNVFYSNATAGMTQQEVFAYDEAGSVKSATLDGVVKRYNYRENGEGELVYSPDPYGMIFAQDVSFEGNVYRTGYSYDVMNRLTGWDYSQGLQIRQEWNNLGQLQEITGYASDFAYDLNGRMTGYVQGNGTSVDYDYDGKGRLSFMYYASAGEPLWSYEYGYDQDDNMVSRNEDHFGYDRNSQLVSTYLVGEDVETEFEVETPSLLHGEMDVLGDGKNTLVSSNLLLDYGASSITVDFNFLYRMKYVMLTPQNSENRVDPENLVIYTADFNEDGYYTLQPDAQVSYENGNLKVEFSEPVFARFLKIHCHYNEMDQYGEPVKAFAQFVVAGTDSVEAYAIVSGRNEFYTYDKKGNRRSRYLMTDKAYYDEYTLYGDSDLMQSDGKYGYEYDKNGNLIAKGTEWSVTGTFKLYKPEELSNLDDLAADGFEYYSYEYDLKNRLRAVYKYNHSVHSMENTATYLYDIDGYRIKKENKAGEETHYVFDTSGKVLEEISLETGDVISSVFLKSRHLARVTEDETLFYGTDHQGSTVIVTDESGDMIWSGEATPFGDAVVRSSGDRSDLDLKYTGKDLDEDTGLYYFNARWYDANTGRFISEDPARDGLNWYVYTSNNPLKFIDPSGMEAEEPDPDDNDEETNTPEPDENDNDNENDDINNQEEPQVQIPENKTAGEGETPESAKEILNEVGIGEDIDSNPISRGKELLGIPYGTGYEGEGNGSMKVPENPPKVDCSEFVAYANDTSIYRTGEIGNNPDYEQVDTPAPQDTKVWRATDPDTGETEGHSAIITGEGGNRELLHADTGGVRYTRDYLESHYRENGYTNITIEYYRRRRN